MISAQARWLRLFLLGSSFFYPLYWTSQFVVFTLPALLRAVLFHLPLNMLEVSFLSSHASVSGETMASVRVEVLVVAIVFAGLVYAFRGFEFVAGAMGIALLGQAALLPFLSGILQRESASFAAVLGVLVAFGIFCAGLRGILKLVASRTLSSRLASIGMTFVLPEVLFWLALRLRYPFFDWRFLALMLGPLVLAAIVTCLLPWKRFEQLPQDKAPPRATEILAGAVLAILFGTGIALSSRALERTREAESRAVLESLPAVPANAPYPKVFSQRGVNFTAEYPAVYGSEGAREMLRRLPAYGINAIALVPYGFASEKEPRVRGWNTRWESDDGVRQLARVAHSLGMKVLLKPQLWTGRGNPGDISFPSAERRAQWFAQYEVFLEHYARLATEIHADVFCIGVELEKMTQYEAEWRWLIARARELYPGPLTYAANSGAEFEHIKFWDALDFIGLDEYYPLPDDLSTDGVVAKIETVQRKFARPVVFTEAGFASLADTNRQPWAESGHAIDTELQARCYEAISSAFSGKPWFAGMYWWKVGTDGGGGPKDGSHTPWGKPAMGVVQRWYAKPAG